MNKALKHLCLEFLHCHYIQWYSITELSPKHPGSLFRGCGGPCTPSLVSAGICPLAASQEEQGSGLNRFGPWPLAGSMCDARQGPIQCFSTCEMGTLTSFQIFQLLLAMLEWDTSLCRIFFCCVGTVPGHHQQVMPSNAWVLLRLGRRVLAFISSGSSLAFCSWTPACFSATAREVEQMGDQVHLVFNLSP